MKMKTNVFINPTIKVLCKNTVKFDLKNVYLGVCLCFASEETFMQFL